MGFFPLYVIQSHLINLQTRLLLDKLIDSLHIHPGNLRRNKCRLGIVVGTKLLQLLLHCQIFRIARVLVGLHMRIAVQTPEFLGDSTVKLQTSQ